MLRGLPWKEKHKADAWVQKQTLAMKRRAQGCNPKRGLTEKGLAMQLGITPPKQNQSHPKLGPDTVLGIAYWSRHIAKRCVPPHQVAEYKRYAAKQLRRLKGHA